MVLLPNLVLGIGCQEVKCGDVKPELSGLGELSEACSERNQIFPRDIGFGGIKELLKMYSSISSCWIPKLHSD